MKECPSCFSQDKEEVFLVSSHTLSLALYFVYVLSSRYFASGYLGRKSERDKERGKLQEEEGKANKTRAESGSGDQSEDFGSFVYPEQDKEDTREMKGDIDVGIFSSQRQTM